jgi:hypothetical protein
MSFRIREKESRVKNEMVRRSYGRGGIGSEPPPLAFLVGFSFVPEVLNTLEREKRSDKRGNEWKSRR